jgi:hypothetical protein
MPLYDITNKPTLVKPEDAESYEVIKVVLKNTYAQSWDRIIKTVDDAISGVKPSESSQLVWTRSAALFGHNSLQPKKHIDHIWDHVIAAVGDDKNCLKAVGGLLRWRISLRPEMWLTVRQETGGLDPDTGKQITASSYWVNEDFVPPSRPAMKSKEVQFPEFWGRC